MKARLLVVAAAMVLGACDEDAGPNVSGLDPLVISRVELQPEVDTVVVQDTITPGDTLRLFAAVVTRTGAVRTDVPLAWLTSDPTVAVVDESGLVRATGYGTATITASAGRQATAEVAVVPAHPADTMPNVVAVAPLASLAVGGETTCALTERGRIFCTGENGGSELGSAARDTVCSDDYAVAGGMVDCSLVPLRVDSPLRFSGVVLGENHGCALDAAGTAFCWGRGEDGQRGDGTTNVVVTPALVSAVHAFSSLTAGLAHTCGIAASGQGWCWGSDSLGQLGNHRLVATSTTPIPVDDVGSPWAQLSAGDRHTCGVTTDGAAYCWGANESGQLGNGTVTDSIPRPVRVAGALAFAQVAAGANMSCGLTQGGTVHCWGAGGSGQLGRGSAASSPVPVPVIGGGGFTALSARGELVCGVRDETAVCWGRYNLGRQGTESAGETPTAVPDGTPIVRVEAGRRHACGLTPAGEVRCWGSNIFGPFGDGLQALWRTSPQRFALPDR